MSELNHTLPIREKIGYSLGDAAANLVWRGALAYLAIFYTDTYGLGAAAVAALLLIVRLSDGVTDVVMGMIADRTNTRWGKYRPWILFSAPALGLFMVLTFTTPNLSDSGKLIYAYLTYIALTLAYTVNNVPYSALMGVMTPNSRERTSLSSYRFAGAFLGGLVVMVGTPELVEYFGQGDKQIGYQKTMYLFAVLLVAMLLITFFSTKERVLDKVELVGESQKTSWGKFSVQMLLACIPLISASLFFYFRDLKSGIFFALVAAASFVVIKRLINKPENLSTSTEKDIVSLVTNTPWLILIGVGFLFMMFNAIKIGAAAYYLKYYIDPSITIFDLFGWWPTWFITDLLSVYFFFLLVISVIAAMCTNFLVKVVGKKLLFILSLALGGLITAAIYFVKPSDLGVLYGLGVLSEFFAAIMPVLFFAMLGDASEYSEWKTGRRATGLFYSAGTFINKTGGGFAGALIVMVLGAFGYVGTDPTTIPLALDSIKWLMSWIPALFALAAALLMVFYPLTQSMLSKIETDLAAARGAQQDLGN